MRSAMLCLLVLAAPAWAQAPTKTPAPNALSPEQARDGWILLFDGESTYGWNPQGPVSISQGAIVLGGAQGGKEILWRCCPPPRFDLAYEIRGAVTHVQGDSVNTIDSGGSWKHYTYSDFFKGRQTFSFSAAKDRAEIRSIKLLPVDTKPLFNGKDLSGWKIFPGKKSKFDVKDGLLAIENGPGDLQTEAKYKNFLLQLECKTNGKHLNSGVFFRCRAGEYQNGYEAQINNNFTASPPKDYVVEEYDSKTNKLLDKKRVKSSAVDFGTGSIYRRIPATKDVAKDGEWFAMTILAHGNHFATWVNGIQTVDWYDNRPPNDNARNGYRREGGHISLQGHDPTTNLSFRNIRIAELPD